MLHQLRLENFKCWRELDVELAPITFFFGTNSSGKTAILQSLLMLKQTVNTRDWKTRLNFGGDRRDFVDLGSYRDLVYGHDESNHIGLSLNWNSAKGDLAAFFPDSEVSKADLNSGKNGSLGYCIRWRLNGDLFVEKLRFSACLFDHTELVVSLERREQDKYAVRLSSAILGAAGHDEDLDQVDADEPDTLEPLGSCFMLPIGLTQETLQESSRVSPIYFSFAFQDVVDDLHYLGPLRQYPTRYYQWTGERKEESVEPDGADTITTLISSARDDDSLMTSVERRLSALDLVESLEVEPTDPNERFHEVTVGIGGLESALLDVGFGVSQVLPVVTMLLSAPKGSILLLEQPELHLHPNAQSLLADLMLSIAEERGIQLIVESHSEHILRRIQRRIAEFEPAFATPENIKMYFCQPGEKGSTVSEVKVDRYGQIANWPDNFLGDISGDIQAMSKAAFKRLREESAGG